MKLKEKILELLNNRKGVFGQLNPLALTLIVFTVIIVVGMVILANISGTVAKCGLAGYTYNTTQNYCWNGSTSATPTGTAYTTGDYLVQQVGSQGSGGLATWTPAIIAVVIGTLFIAIVVGGFGRSKGRY